MSSQQPNMGHRHSLTIETNPLHLLPSNVRRFSVDPEQAKFIPAKASFPHHAKNGNNNIEGIQEEQRKESTSK